MCICRRSLPVSWRKHVRMYAHLIWIIVAFTMIWRLGETSRPSPVISRMLWLEMICSNFLLARVAENDSLYQIFVQVESIVQPPPPPLTRWLFTLNVGRDQQKEARRGNEIPKWNSCLIGSLQTSSLGKVRSHSPVWKRAFCFCLYVWGYHDRDVGKTWSSSAHCYSNLKVPAGGTSK